MRPTGETRLGSEDLHIENPRSRCITKRYVVTTVRRLEGSRFISGQLCELSASGSRELPKTRQFYWQRANCSPSEESRWVNALCWVIPGSRLLPSDRTAELLSGSPPSVGYAQARVFIGRAGTKRTSGLSLIELLVVLTIIAFIAALITTSVLSALSQQNQRVCLNNMLTIEAAKDEYLRDHPGATSIPSRDAFQPYFRFGIPTCPDGGTYNNLLSLNQPVTCTFHTTNSVYPTPTP
jgi:prepilin-type N-terminal cleavage/methylation domain-containing protein